MGFFEEMILRRCVFSLWYILPQNQFNQSSPVPAQMKVKPVHVVHELDLN